MKPRKQSNQPRETLADYLARDGRVEVCPTGIADALSPAQLKRDGAKRAAERKAGGK